MGKDTAEHQDKVEELFDSTISKKAGPKTLRTSPTNANNVSFESSYVDNVMNFESSVGSQLSGNSEQRKVNEIDDFSESDEEK